MNLTKLHASLAASLEIAAKGETLLPIIVKVRPGAIARGEVQILSTFRPHLQFRRLEAQAIHIAPADLDALSEDPAVEFIWPDLPVHTWLEEAVPCIRAPRVWESGFTGKGVRVALLDTGLDAEHPDLADRLLAYRDFVSADGPGAGVPRDPNGHGTHVAGIVAGSGQAAGGRYRGVAPDARLIVARALDEMGTARTSQVMAALEWAIDQGAQVINLSLGGGPYPADGTDALSTLCNAAVEEGVVVCAAAGNLGPARQSIGAPAAAQQVITVGAADIRQPLAATVVADFSSRGPTADGRLKPDLIFPGRGVIAPRARGTSLGQPVGERYTRLNGTSQAAPMVAGTAALLLQANPRLSPAEIKARLMRGARRLKDAPPEAQGSGLGDALNTFLSAIGAPLAEAGSPSPDLPPPSSPPTEPVTRPSRPGCSPLRLASRRHRS